MTKAERGEQRELWRQRVAQQMTSGLSVREFCREHKLTDHAFYWWRHRLNAAEPPLRFALVDTAAPTVVSGPTSEPRLELFLHSGERLCIPADADTLRLVLKTLREG